MIRNKIAFAVLPNVIIFKDSVICNIIIRNKLHKRLTDYRITVGDRRRAGVPNRSDRF